MREVLAADGLLLAWPVWAGAVMDLALISAGQMYRYYLRHVVTGDTTRPAGTGLRAAQVGAGVPAGRWTGQGLAAMGLMPGRIVTEPQLRRLFGQARHPDADALEAARLAAGDPPAVARRAGALGRAVKRTGVDLVFRPAASVQVLWALGDEVTRRLIEAAVDRAIDPVLAEIERDAVVRWGKAGAHHAHPPGGLVAAGFRHYTSRAGTPLLHVHLLVSVKCRRPDGAWGSAHTPVFFENTVAWSALFNELVMSEVCQALGLATEPRTVTQGRRPVMELAGISHELIHWMAVRGRDIDERRTELERDYLTTTTATIEADDGTPACRPGVVTEATRTALNRIAARQTRPPKPPQAQPLHRLRASWRADAVRRFGQAVVDGLLAQARAAATVIRARLRDVVVDVAAAAAYITAVVAVMRQGRFRRRHLLAEARRHLAHTLQGKPRAPGLDHHITDTALTEHCHELTAPDAPADQAVNATHRLYRTRVPLPPELTALEEQAPPALTDQDGLPRPPLRYGHAVAAGLWLQRQLPSLVSFRARERGREEVGEQAPRASNFLRRPQG
ncbi:MobF family relaxase [Actinacidiphila glaucinigra]